MSMHFTLIMKCGVEKRGLHIVVRKGGREKRIACGVLWMFSKELEVL
jgi:hypothetical protein